MTYLLIYLLEILLSSIGLFFDCLYLNLLTIGYTLGDFVYFIIRRLECNCLIIGIMLLLLVIKKKGRVS